MDKTPGTTITGHPCFDPAVRHNSARLHLPVIRECNVQCRFCNRRFDCVNESRPGVTSALISPAQAVAYVGRCIDTGMPLAVAGIAGPGDAFAQPDVALETLGLVKQHYPHLLLCVATNGLAAPPYVPALAAIGVSHVSVTVNGVDPAIVGRIYAWARYGRRVVRNEEMAECIIARQAETIAALVKSGITVKVNMIVIPGVNGHHVEAVAKGVAALGAGLFNCIPLLPTPGTDFETIGKPDHELMQTVRWQASRHLTIMHHCAHCRADAAGLIGEDNQEKTNALLTEISNDPRTPREDRPYLAVTTREGIFINEHLGAALTVSIYEQKGPSLVMRTTRAMPPSGGGEERWTGLAAILKDCRALLTYRCGAAPRRSLEASGLKVIETEGFIDETLTAVFNGRAVASRPQALPCGQGCTGSGGGCG